jgi:glycosyltransferase involved in cell wall biosynthesis
VLRIAMVIQRYYPLLGGQEKQCRLLVRRLAESGNPSVPFILTRRLVADLPPRGEIDDVPVRRLGAAGTGRWASYTFYLGVAWTLLRERKNYDVVHCHSSEFLGFVSAAMARLLGKPVVLKLSMTGEFIEERSFQNLGALAPHLRRWMRERTAQHACMVALNREGLGELERAGVRRRQLIANGIDHAVYRPLPEREREERRCAKGLLPADVAFLCTSRFVERKGIDLLLEAFGALAAADARLWLVGSSELQPYPVDASLIAAAVARMPRQIMIERPTEAVLEYLQLADVFVHPSRREGMPNAVLEAFAVGLPCVLSDIEPHIELAETNPGSCITFFRSGDSSSLRAALDAALRDRRRPNRHAALSEAYDSRHVAREYARLYAELAGSLTE